MHKVVILAVDGFDLFDLAIPADIFNRARSRAGERLYKTYICGKMNSVTGTLLDLKLSYNLNMLSDADTIIVPGTEDDSYPIPPEILDALRNAADRGVRIASICAGAFVLAEAGLLNGLKATTHWRAVDNLASRYPEVSVEPDVLFIDNGQILTSAGVASGVDLCLHMIRKDYGAIVAADIAQDIVMPQEREGWQSQLLKHTEPAKVDDLKDIQMWMLEHIKQEFSIGQIAEHFHMSVRTLNRRFQKEVGITPLRWLLSIKVRQAQALLESSNMSIEDIATATGFASAAAFREHFFRVTGTTPTGWRNTYSVSINSREAKHNNHK